MRFEKYYIGKTDEHKGLFYQLRGKESAPNRVPDGNFNMVNETSENNGITKKASSKNIFKAPALTVSVNFAQTVFLQEEDFCASVNILILKSDWLDIMPEAGLYVVTVLKKNNQKYNYSYKISKDRLNDTIIELPTLDNIVTDSPYSDSGYVPDFKYMYDYIKELEQDYIKELEQDYIKELDYYLKAADLDDYTLTDEENTLLELSLHNSEQDGIINGNIKEVREFVLHDIAKVEYGNKFDKNKMTHMNPSINFVSRTAANNGISDFVDMHNNIKPYDPGAITLALGGSIGSCFVQTSPFYTGQNVGVITLQNNVSEKSKLYISVALGKKCKASFTAFGNEINKHLKTDLSVPLPIQTDSNNNPIIDSTYKYHSAGYIPDWEFMEKYINAIEKSVITNVVIYKNKEISKLKMISDS